MKIAGIDLSTNSTGYAHPDGSTSVIKPGKLRGGARLAYNHDALAEHLFADQPELVVIEDYAVGCHDTATRPTAELHGVFEMLAWRWGLTVVRVNPTTLKCYAMGSGKAKKEQMLAEAVSRFGIRFVTNDECDAFWLRAAALDHYGESIVKMPQKNKDYLAKVDWPVRGGW